MDIVETDNAIYVIKYIRLPHDIAEWSVDDVLEHPVDAFVVENAGADLPVEAIEKRMDASRRVLGNRNPDVFLVDPGASQEQLRRYGRNWRTSWAIRGAGLAGVGVYAGLKYLSKKAREREAADTGSRPLSRLVRGLRAVKNRAAETKTGQRVSAVLERRRQKSGQMSPGRRNFLKVGAALGTAAVIGGPIAAAELWHPALLRNMGSDAAEKISLANNNFVTSGRNAAMARRLEESVAPVLRRENNSNRKPVIGVVLGEGHNAFPKYLKSRSFRDGVLKKFEDRGDLRFLSERDPVTGDAIRFLQNRLIQRFHFRNGKWQKVKSMVPPLAKESSPSAMRNAGRNVGRSWNSRLAMAKRNRNLAKAKPKRTGFFRRK